MLRGVRLHVPTITPLNAGNTPRKAGVFPRERGGTPLDVGVSPLNAGNVHVTLEDVPLERDARAFEHGTTPEVVKSFVGIASCTARALAGTPRIPKVFPNDSGAVPASVARSRTTPDLSPCNPGAATIVGRATSGNSRSDSLEAIRPAGDAVVTRPGGLITRSPFTIHGHAWLKACAMAQLAPRAFAMEIPGDRRKYTAKAGVGRPAVP